MFSGTVCPQCGKPVMPYGRFFKVAEPHKTSRCSHCSVELKRKKSVWLLLGAGAVVVVLIVGFGVPFTFVRWGVVASAVFVIVFTAVAIFALNICGWLFVGWELVSLGKAGNARLERNSRDPHSDQPGS
jgi:uncharacterized protein (DUF983 family)